MDAQKTSVKIYSSWRKIFLWRRLKIRFNMLQFVFEYYCKHEALLTFIMKRFIEVTINIPEVLQSDGFQATLIKMVNAYGFVE